MKKIVVAIDGPAAAGKSTAGKNLAAALGYLYIDTGALYRATGLKASRAGIRFEDGPQLAAMLASTTLRFTRDGRGMRILLDEEDVTEAIRGERMGFAASAVSAQSEVRAALLDIQRNLGRNGGIVMDGRDIGTVIFPAAEAKFFLVAALDERAHRRWLEMRAAGKDVSEQSVREDIRRRDEQDSSRAHAPLTQAPDAFRVDTTGLEPEQTLALIRSRVEEIIARK